MRACIYPLFPDAVDHILKNPLPCGRSQSDVDKDDLDGADDELQIYQNQNWKKPMKLRKMMMRLLPY